MLIILVTLLVAYANGANAVFKGVASLYGSGTASFASALRLATITTACGAIASMFFAEQLLKAFSGKGVVPDLLVDQPAFLLSVGIGALVTGGLATVLGFPVSTTHALLGGLLGAGLVAAPNEVNFGRLQETFFLPLLVSPLVAALIGFCIAKLSLRGRSLLTSHHRTVDRLHYVTAGCVSFARGMNDTPKMAALMLVVATMQDNVALILVTIAMTIGGLVSSRNVAETLSHKITAMDSNNAWTANLTTAILVTIGTLKGLPLSTTHVSVGALLGLGAALGKARWKTIVPVVLAWLITLPCAALCAALAWGLIQWTH